MKIENLRTFLGLGTDLVVIYPIIMVITGQSVLEMIQIYLTCLINLYYTFKLLLNLQEEKS